ncbi:hypothetical protein BV22DRAFT_669832 [Leucogyrophana mollusca]|uniref:Uncharacterized protein n=1 Tax=Leucogyrophana mollusca TaxID=85980 RepID=A0ACB8B9A5_9AGAM|nr:hypothetical protein BV22DRAFT_669832 [Leucogyrophana mollusca]
MIVAGWQLKNPQTLPDWIAKHFRPPASRCAMDSFIQILYTTQFINYLTMASAAVVMYDHLLNFSEELDLIWNRQWSLTTVLYLVARYSGSVSVFGEATTLVGLDWTLTVMKTLSIVVVWSTDVFTIAMQGILLMRVYALCNKSKKVLVFLLVCFFAQAIVVVVLAGIQCNLSSLGKYLLSAGPPIGSVTQEASTNPSALGSTPTVEAAVALAFDTMMLAFAVFAFIIHAVESRRLTGHWSVNPLIKVLATDQTLYFFCYAVRQAIVIPMAAPTISLYDFSLLDGTSNLLSALVVIAGPRMVISLRARELKTRENTFQEEVSTIRFGARDPPVRSIGDVEPVVERDSQGDEVETADQQV